MNTTHMVIRPEPWKRPSLQLPFYVRSTGHHQFGNYSKANPSFGDGFVQVFWGISGEIELHVDATRMSLKAGDVIWKLRKESHGYRSRLPGGEFRWFTFEGPLADGMMLGYGYPRRLPDAGPCPVGLFLEIEHCLKEMSPYSQRRLLSIATELLALAGGRLNAKEEGSRVVERAVAMIQAQYGEPDFNVNTLSDDLGCHRATLTRRFAEKMGASPGEYLARLRMQHASALLRNSLMPIAEIGETVGMPNHSHFSRAVKRATGLTPGALRKLGPEE